MRNIVWILFVAVLASCQDVTIGFLNVEKAGYEIDSLEVKAVLDNAVPEIIPNPEYERYVDMGFDPERCIEMGIYPTLEIGCLLYTSPSPRDLSTSRMPSSA